MSENIEHVIREATEGRPYIFVIADFKRKEGLWKGTIKPIVEHETQHACVRAYEASAAGHGLLDKIQRMIVGAELVIADISTDSPNVYYEIGYTVGRNRPLLLLAEQNAGEEIRVPTDLKGYELIAYSNGIGGPEKLEQDLRKHLHTRVRTRLGLLRDMLIAPRPTPAYIAASPRRVSNREQAAGQLRSQLHHRTFGDNIGIRGVLEAFGFLFGADSGVELISAQFAPPHLLEDAVSLYLVGSKKVNPLAGIFLEKLQAPDAPEWYFGALEGDNGSGRFVFNDRRLELERADDYHCRFFRREHDYYVELPHKMKNLEDGTPYHKLDCGLLVRAPHPRHSDRLVVLMAGPHSLGSGAAGMAATNARLIQQLQDRLQQDCGVELADKSKPVWALLEATANRKDGGLKVKNVKIKEVGVLANGTQRK